jgi:hypothetical protein
MAVRATSELVSSDRRRGKYEPDRCGGSRRFLQVLDIIHASVRCGGSAAVTAVACNSLKLAVRRFRGGGAAKPPYPLYASRPAMKAGASTNWGSSFPIRFSIGMLPFSWCMPTITAVSRNRRRAGAEAVITVIPAGAGVAGVGRLTLSRRERMVMVEPRGTGMAVFALRAADEVRMAQFRSPEGDLDTEMVAIARAIIRQRIG